MLPTGLWGRLAACLWILMSKHFRDFGVDSGHLIAVKQLSGGTYEASLAVGVTGVEAGRALCFHTCFIPPSQAVAWEGVKSGAPYGESKKPAWNSLL